MAGTGRGIGALFLFMAIGALVGTVLGEILGAMLGDTGLLGLIFTHGIPFGLNSPVTVDLRVLTFTFGVSFKMTLLSVLGLLFGIYLSRKV